MFVCAALGILLVVKSGMLAPSYSFESCLKIPLIIKYNQGACKYFIISIFFFKNWSFGRYGHNYHIGLFYNGDSYNNIVNLVSLFVQVFHLNIVNKIKNLIIILVVFELDSYIVIFHFLGLFNIPFMI